MTSEQLADRIESLDWSGTSLQHQLAMSAAVACLRNHPEPTVDVLRGEDPAPLENPVREMQLLLTDLLRGSGSRWGKKILKIQVDKLPWRSKVASTERSKQMTFNRDFALVDTKGRILAESHNAARLESLRIELVEEGVETSVLRCEMARRK